jgi:hypothetical protein
VVYIGGVYSHAFRKGPLLQVGDSLVSGLFAPEQITRREPDADERRVASVAFASIAEANPLYARIDLIRDNHGAPVLLELELTEPSLYVVHAPEAAGRFADAALAA